MPITYKNRMDKTYYLHQGKTKTGKPRYFFSMKQDGQLVDEIPEGYEVYEHPSDARVFIRKKQPRLITDIEDHVVKKYLGKLKTSRPYIIDIKSDTITIFQSDKDPDEVKKSYDRILKYQIPPERESLIQWIVESADYAPVLKFVLEDEKKRSFNVQRLCFLGSIENWMHIGGPDSLEKLAQKYIKHLGQESFFDLV